MLIYSYQHITLGNVWTITTWNPTLTLMISKPDIQLVFIRIHLHFIL